MEIDFIVRISILQPAHRERERHSQYRQYGSIGTVNPCENCDVVAEWHIRRENAIPKGKNAVLKNIALTNWQAVANDVLLHSELRQDIVKALCRKLSVNAEFKNIKELMVVHKFFG